MDKVALKKRLSKFENILNILVLLCSLAIIGILSFEFFSSDVIGIPEGSKLLNSQFIICIVFLLDFFVRLFISDDLWRFVRNNWLFLVVSIPYLSIVHYYNIDLTNSQYIVLKIMPLIRGGYGVIILINWVTRNSITSLFFAYISTILSLTYFSSMIFYSMEKSVNPLVDSFEDALWWAFMDLTTVGSNIYAMTQIGRILSVVLAAAGMMLFPIFTVYITDRFTKMKHNRSYVQHKDSSKDSSKES